MSDRLDNPVWYALSQTHAGFATNSGEGKFYQPDYCPFGSFESPQQHTGSITHYARLTDNFFIVGERPEIPNHLTIKKELVCLQMIRDKKMGVESTEEIVMLTDEHNHFLFEFVNRVQPEYFRQKTMKLGDYFGLFKNQQLIAAAGERMKMNDCTEISAVVTNPQFTGKGYASQLIAHTVNNILAQNKIPFLHVAETNHGAIHLYQKLGFSTRRKISFWNIAK